MKEGIFDFSLDAATINIYSFAKSLQEKIFDAYFSDNGIGYSVGRIPMASCDFSTHVYSYDDHDGDFQLQNFSLVEEDLKFKIPGKILVNCNRNLAFRVLAVTEKVAMLKMIG